jgi:hypothetical protein
LKNAHSAGNALETGEHYQEAASVYLKYANNKNKAAECFEKGSMTMDAIGLYKELNQDEKVGDLYITIHFFTMKKRLRVINQRINMSKPL